MYDCNVEKQRNLSEMTKFSCSLIHVTEAGSCGTRAELQQILEKLN